MKTGSTALRLWLLVGVFVASSFALLFLPTGAGSYPGSLFLGDRAAWFVDLEGRDDAAVLADAERLFTSSDGRLVNRGVVGGVRAPLWLRFTVPALGGDETTDQTLSLDETRVRAVTLHIEKDGRRRTFDYVAGRPDRVVGRPLRFFALTLPAPDWSGATVTMKIVTPSSKRAVLWLEPSEVAAHREARQALFFGLLFGVQLALFVYLLGLGLSLRDPALIALGALSFVYSLNVLADRGFVETVIWPGGVMLGRLLSFATTFAAYAAWLAFLRAYLQVPRWSPRLARILVWAVGIDLLLTAAAIVDVHFDTLALRPVSAQIGLAGLLLGTATAVRALFAETGRAIVFLLAWTPSVAAVAARLTMDARPGAFDGLVPVQTVYIGLIVGLLTFAVVLSLDIRDREVALRRLAEDNAAKLNDYAAAASDGFFEIDREGRTVEISGAAAAQFVEGVGRPLLERVADAPDNADAVRLVGQSIAYDLPFRAVLFRAPVPGGDRLFEISGRPAGAGFRGIVADVTERERAKAVREREIRFAAIGQLAANLAHDVNNLLHPIINLSRRVRDRLTDDEAGRRHLDNVTRAGERASTVVARFLATAHGARDFGLKAPLSEAVREIAAELLPLVDGRCRVETRIEEAGGPVVPLSEAYRLLSNLVSNAVQACAGGGLVEISLEREGDGVRLTVRDDGAGMDAETRARLDQPGFTTRPLGEGSGLGLGIVREIAGLWGARLDIVSTPGRGTAVSLVFEPPADAAEVSV